jgi:translocator protein
MKKRINFKILVLSFIIVYSFAFLGSILTLKSVNSEWYDSIKPSITPPNWVFPVIWNILFFLIALSLFLSLTKAKNKNLKWKIKSIFGINLSLNVLWSFFYFYLKQPLYAFFDLILLWLSIIFMIYLVWKINKKSAWLLVPYLLWVTFAGVLNYLSIQ